MIKPNGNDDVRFLTFADVANAMTGLVNFIKSVNSVLVESGLTGETVTPMDKRAKYKTGMWSEVGEIIKATSFLVRVGYVVRSDVASDWNWCMKDE